MVLEVPMDTLANLMLLGFGADLVAHRSTIDLIRQLRHHTSKSKTRAFLLVVLTLIHFSSRIVVAVTAFEFTKLACLNFNDLLARASTNKVWAVIAFFFGGRILVNTGWINIRLARRAAINIRNRRSIRRGIQSASVETKVPTSLSVLGVRHAIIRLIIGLLVIILFFLDPSLRNSSSISVLVP